MVNVGRAKTDQSRLLARVEAGERVEIARDGVPVARLVRVEPPGSPGARFLAARGRLAGHLDPSLADVPLPSEGLDVVLDDPLDPL